MLKQYFVSSAAAATVALVFLGGSAQALAGEEWRWSHQEGWSGDSNHDVQVQGETHDSSWMSDLNFGLGLGTDGSSDLPLLLADASEIAAAEAEPKSAECAAFEKDIDANLGDVLRAGCEPTLAQMSALMDNPLGNVAMFFNQFDLYQMENPAFDDKEKNQWMYTGILQFPKRLSDDWNLINRIVLTVPSVPLDQDKIDDFNLPADPGIPPGGGPIQEPPGPVAPVDLFSGRTTGLGDSYYVGLFSPYEGIKHENGATSVWGAGFDLGVPTATEDILGSGKWSAGPAGLFAYLGPKWKLGALVQHYWDFAGDDDQADVNLTNLQYLYYYSLDETTSIGAMPNIIANWELSGGDRFTVPIGIGINKTIQFGKVPVRFGIEYHYSVIQPDDTVGADWDLRFYFAPAAPSALFGWMQ